MSRLLAAVKLVMDETGPGLKASKTLVERVRSHVGGDEKENQERERVARLEGYRQGVEAVAAAASAGQEIEIQYGHEAEA